MSDETLGRIVLWDGFLEREKRDDRVFSHKWISLGGGGGGGDEGVTSYLWHSTDVRAE